MKKCIAWLLTLLCALAIPLSAWAQTANDEEIVIGGALAPDIGAQAARPQSEYAVSEAEYPAMSAHPDEADYITADGEFDDVAYYAAYDEWRAGRYAPRAEKADVSGLNGYFISSAREFLSESNDENRVYSPLSAYMALGMLAELTAGESRAQILELLGAPDIETLRAQAKYIWYANYCDDGIKTSVLASSIWLNDNMIFKKPALDELARAYCASSYQGEMGAGAFDAALQSWLNDQTGGLLEKQAGEVKLNAETALALATAVCFKGKWSDDFNKNATSEGVFRLANGGAIICDFMRQSGGREYYWGENFSSVAQQFEGGGSMWLILPDEGVSIDELLADNRAMDFILTNGMWQDRKHLKVNLSVPKFDIASNLDIIAGLKALGINDVFDPTASDFSPMTDMANIFVSQASHAARVKIDETGCEAAAYTIMIADVGAAMPPDEEIDFILDRPFVFAITGANGLPLFIGVVNNP